MQCIEEKKRTALLCSLTQVSACFKVNENVAECIDTSGLSELVKGLICEHS